MKSPLDIERTPDLSLRVALAGLLFWLSPMAAFAERPGGPRHSRSAHARDLFAPGDVTASPDQSFALLACPGGACLKADPGTGDAEPAYRLAAMGAVLELTATNEATRPNVKTTAQVRSPQFRVQPDGSARMLQSWLRPPAANLPGAPVSTGWLATALGKVASVALAAVAITQAPFLMDTDEQLLDLDLDDGRTVSVYRFNGMDRVNIEIREPCGAVVCFGKATRIPFELNGESPTTRLRDFKSQALAEFFRTRDVWNADEYENLPPLQVPLQPGQERIEYGGVVYIRDNRNGSIQPIFLLGSHGAEVGNDALRMAAASDGNGNGGAGRGHDDVDEEERAARGRAEQWALQRGWNPSGRGADIAWDVYDPGSIFSPELRPGIPPAPAASRPRGWTRIHVSIVEEGTAVVFQRNGHEIRLGPAAFAAEAKKAIGNHGAERRPITLMNSGGNDVPGDAAVPQAVADRVGTPVLVGTTVFLPTVTPTVPQPTPREVPTEEVEASAGVSRRRDRRRTAIRLDPTLFKQRREARLARRERRLTTKERPVGQQAKSETAYREPSDPLAVRPQPGLRLSKRPPVVFEFQVPPLQDGEVGLRVSYPNHTVLDYAWNPQSGTRRPLSITAQKKRFEGHASTVQVNAPSSVTETRDAGETWHWAVDPNGRRTLTHVGGRDVEDEVLDAFARGVRVDDPVRQEQPAAFAGAVQMQAERVRDALQARLLAPGAHRHVNVTVGRDLTREVTILAKEARRLWLLSAELPTSSGSRVQAILNQIPVIPGRRNGYLATSGTGAGVQWATAMDIFQLAKGIDAVKLGDVDRAVEALLDRPHILRGS